MRLTTFLKKILGIANTVVDSVDLEEPPERARPVIRVRTRRRKPRCGSCGRKARRLHGTKGKQRSWRHLGLLGCGLFISSTIHRVLCPKCGVRTMEVPWARTASLFTRQFEDQVAWFLQKTDQTATAQYFAISWRTVGRIARRVVEEKLDKSLLDGLRFIGVDEIRCGRPRKFLTVVIDHERGRIVWAAEGKSSTTLKSFFTELGSDRTARIDVVSMDMDPAFEKAVRETAPSAEIVYDRFHVVQLLSKTVDEVRRELVRLAPPEKKRDLKSTRWALLKNPWNLTPREKWKLATIQQTNQPLYPAYLLKESFQDIFTARSPKIADFTFDQWFAWSRRSALEPFKKLALTLKNHWEGICRFITHKITNGAVEGYNSKIRMISHRAFGFPSAAALIAMIHLNCSGIHITPIGC